MDLKSGVVRRHADLNKEGNQSMKTKKTYRMLALLLAVVMVFGALPVTATARSAGDDGSVEMNEA